jgi:hypothetical protein
MRIIFPFEALTKIGFLRICFFNLFSENFNLPRHSFLRLFTVYEKFDTDNTFV